MNSELTNYYAPGVATYGLDGKAGERGSAGTSIYFSSYNLADNSIERNEAIGKINQNKILSKYVDQPNGRAYINGDLILDTTGTIYRLNIGNIITFVKIINLNNIINDNEYFKANDNRIYFDASTATGFDIVSGKTVPEDSTYPLRVLNTEENTNTSDYNLVSLQAKNGTDISKYLNIIYNKNDDAFYVNTNSKLALDASSIVINGNDAINSELTDYYKICPQKDPIGLIHKIYKEADIKVENKTFTAVLDKDAFADSMNVDVTPDFVKFQTFSNNMLVDEYYYKPSVSTNENGDKVYTVSYNDDIDSFKSLIYLVKGIEVCVYDKF